MNHNELCNALIKFQQWNKELEELVEECHGSTAADALMEKLYVEEQVFKLIGGPNAPIFFDSLKRIQALEDFCIQLLLNYRTKSFSKAKEIMNALPTT